MRIPLRSFYFGMALTLMSGSCSKKADVKTGVSELEKAFPTAAAQSSGQAQPAVANASPQGDADDLVKAALSAARANDYASSVIALQAAQARPGLTADQVMAAQRAKQALVGELQRRAVNGDQKAMAQLDAIEKTRSQ